MTNSTKKHLQRVAEYGQQNGCVCCGEPFSHLHHILEGRTPGRKSSDFTVIPLCLDCHTGFQGIHGDRLRWSLRKMDELKALAKTIEGVFYGKA